MKPDIRITIQTYNPYRNLSHTGDTLKVGDVLTLGAITLKVKSVTYHLNVNGWVNTIEGEFTPNPTREDISR